jgi:hypothetical protein
LSSTTRLLSVSPSKQGLRCESFAPIASLFKQFELIYVVGDERDIVRVFRTNYRDEEVYLYRIKTSPRMRVAFDLP